MELAEAYRECERITWSQARNFAYGIRLLPPGKRRGLAAIYAFARRIDDIGDGTMPAEHKIEALEDARRAVLDLTRPAQDDPVLIALADVGRNFPVPMQAFGELIDGCVADVRGTSYQTFDDLLYYCRCVAGSVGRLSLGIFGTRPGAGPAAEGHAAQGHAAQGHAAQGHAAEGHAAEGAAAEGPAAELADSLGVAMQLTNILRDIREDYANGRVYLPAEDLVKFGVDLGGDDGVFPGGRPPGIPPVAGEHLQAPASPGPAWSRLIEFEVDRARDWYATGLALLPMLDRRSAACTGAMAGIYRRLLERIAAQPGAVLHGRMSLPAGEKAIVAVRALAGRIR